MANIWQFYKLQQIDSESADLKEKESSLDSGNGFLTKLNEIEDKNKENKAVIEKNKLKIKNFELEIQSLETQRKSFEDKLYGGTSSNPKELESWQSEINQLKAQQMKVEDKVLDILEENEKRESESINLQNENNLIKKQYEEVHQNYLSQKDDIDKRLETLNKRKQTIVESMTREDFAEYEDIKSKKNGIVVAVIKENSCSACYMSLPESAIKKAKGRSVAFCPNCARMLYCEE